jgi:hypothetical protein
MAAIGTYSRHVGNALHDERAAGALALRAGDPEWPVCVGHAGVRLGAPERIWCRFIREKDRTIRGADQKVAERTPFFPGDARTKASSRATCASSEMLDDTYALLYI